MLNLSDKIENILGPFFMAKADRDYLVMALVELFEKEVKTDDSRL